MGQVNQASNLLDRLKRAEQNIQRLWKSIGLSSATIESGNLTILGGSLVISQNGAILAGGQVLMQADPLGGLSRPWSAMPLRPMFDDGAILGASSNRSNAGFYGPLELRQGQIATDQLVWAGTIPELYHPQVSFYGWFGYTTNPNTLTVTIKFNGTTVATITASGLILPQTVPSIYGPYNVVPFLGQQAIQVTVFASSTQTQGPNDLLACDFEQMVLRGS